MRLTRLISCDIYRDGGSIEAVWLNDQNEEWSITLQIDPWNDATEEMRYALFPSKLADVDPTSRIAKGSTQHSTIMTMINTWANDGSETEHKSLNHLLSELRKGNY